jgi:hypothetical protein
LNAAKQDKPPVDGAIYGLKDGGFEELTAGMFGVANAVDGIPPNSAGNVPLNAAHRISIPDTNQGIGQTPVGETINTLFFDTAATPAIVSVDEYIEIERADGSTVFLRSKTDGSFVFDGGATETALYSPAYGRQVSSQAVDGTLIKPPYLPVCGRPRHAAPYTTYRMFMTRRC